MASFRILSAEKKAGETLEQVEQLLAQAYPDWRIENIVEVDGEWQARLVQDRISKSQRQVVAGDPPPFLKKKDEADDDSSDSSDSDSSDDSDSDDSEDDEMDSDKEDKSDSSDKKEKGKTDPVAEVKKIMDELQGLLSDLGGKAQEMQDAHDDKAQKLKDIADTVGDDGGMPEGVPSHDGPVPPGAVGPHPGGPPMAPPPSDIPPVPRRPGVPSGRMPVPGRPSAFASERRTEIAYHSGLDHAGQPITIEAARHQLESDPDFKEYQVVDIRQGNDGRYVAKLQKGSPYPSDSYKNAPDHTPKSQKDKWPEEVNAIYNACMREGRGRGDSKEEKESSCAAIAWAQYNKNDGSPSHSDKDK
jgi:hypothetical protein